eukprot:COSAG04_NODE_21328_length_375_cov_2.786232_1_plen_72_part_10
MEAQAGKEQRPGKTHGEGVLQRRRVGDAVDLIRREVLQRRREEAEEVRPVHAHLRPGERDERDDAVVVHLLD